MEPETRQANRRGLPESLEIRLEALAHLGLPVRLGRLGRLGLLEHPEYQEILPLAPALEKIPSLDRSFRINRHNHHMQKRSVRLGVCRTLPNPLH